jgi:hypothetical protein
MHISRIKKRVGGKLYVTTLIRESYREGKKVKHRTIANISKLPSYAIHNIEESLKNPAVSLQKINELRIENSREYGASKAFLDLIKKLELESIIYSRKEAWRQDVLAMIVGRLVYQGSKLHLAHLHKDSVLWELASGYKGCPDVAKNCYQPLDRLMERQAVIQRELARRHLSEGCLVMYDITSSYLEGAYQDSELVDFGYSRDQKRNHEQIVIGLLTSKEGCPVAVEWRAIQKLQPIFAMNGKGQGRRFSMQRIIERLKSIRIQNCSFNEIQVEGIITTPDNEQEKFYSS